MKARALLTLAIAVLAVLSPARASAASTGNLIERARVVEASGVDRPERVIDGEAAREGDPWSSTVAARFRGPAASLVIDLGAVHRVEALFIQADNDDDYVVETSVDATRFAAGWRSGPGSGSGLRSRSATGLGLSARYLRLSVEGGDGNFSVSELEAFETVPEPFPPEVPRVHGVPIERQAHNAILSFGLALVFFVTFALKRFPWAATVLLGFVPLYFGYRLVAAIPPGYPLDPEIVSLTRGVVALAAAIAVAREAFGPARFAPDPRAILGALALAAAFSVACFYNLGTAQFWDAAQSRPTFVHYLDLRQYFTTAKYFEEIGYRHIYEADIAAYLEDTGKGLDEIADVPMRDLDTHEILTVGALRAKVGTAKARFSPDRWQAYRTDARFLRDTMGTAAWLNFLVDYGGNATPVWIGVAHVLFGLGPASERLFLATGSLDPLLLLATFVAIGRTFGARTALVCMVVFGTNDFIMYGSDWAGATLRHDWLAYLGLGACALRRERWVAGGALIGASAMIRAFPAVALAGVLVAPCGWLAAHAKATRRIPTLASFRREHGDALRVVAGAAVTAVVLAALSMALVPPAAWLDWSRKVALLSADVHPTHVGLRSVVGGWEGDQPEVLRERALLFATCTALFLGLIVLACRRRGPSQAAMLALLAVPIVMYPANYYLHLVFLVPIAATVSARGEEEQPGVRTARAKAWIILLVLSVGQYFVALEQSFALHFFVESAMLLATMFAFLAVIASSPSSNEAPSAAT